MREEQGKLRHLNTRCSTTWGRPAGQFVVVATTRPETMLGDRRRRCYPGPALPPIGGRALPAAPAEQADSHY